MTSVRRIHIAVAMLVFLLSACRLGFGQAITGDILGTIQDSTGAVVPNAKVTLTATDTGVTRQSTSDAGGNYLFAQLKPGHYAVQAVKQGFETATVTGIELLVGQRPRVDVILRVGAVTQSIEVNAGGVQLLDSQTSSVGEVIQQKPIVEMPLNGRDFMQLTSLAPTVQPSLGQNDVVDNWTGFSQGMGSTTVAGMRESNIGYLLDGIETRQARYGSSDLHPSIDALQEFKMQTDAYSAQYGKSSAVVNMTLKSGTNAFHGDTYEFNRVSALGANDFFRNEQGLPIPPFTQNDFGATLGGPIRKDKTFFFVSYEGFRSRTAAAGEALAITAAQWEGNLTDNSAGTGVFPTDSSFCQANPTASSVRCANIINPSTGQAFAGNVIPAAMLDSRAQKWRNFYLTPNIAFNPNTQVAIPTFNYASTPGTRNDFNNVIGRLDHTLGSKDQLYGNYAFDDLPHVVHSVLPLDGETYPIRSQEVSMTETHIFSPNVVNEARMGYNRGKLFLWGQGANGPNYAAETFGFTNTEPNPLDFGVPDLSMTNYAGAGSVSESAGGFDQNFQWWDDLSIVHGSHNLKVGGDVWRERFWQITDDDGVPGFTFTGQFTGSSIADMLLGIPDTADTAVGSSVQDLRSTYYAMFIQDDWRVRPSLTLNLGLRYEYTEPPWDIYNRTAWFNPSIGAYQYSSAGQVRNGIVNPDHRNFAPRVGFAYSPRFLHGTVVRGAYGIFYATDSWNNLQFLVEAPQYYSEQTFTSNPTTPTLQLDNLFPTLTAASTTATPFSIYAGSRTPYVQEWNLGIQHAFKKDWVVDISYVGNRGEHLVVRSNLDAASFDPTGTIPLAQREPWPQYSGILWDSDSGWSLYNALAARVERRVAGGLYLLGSYSYSHCIDITSYEGADELYVGRQADIYNKGQCVYNTPQRFVGSYVYELPFGPGKHFLGGVGGVAGKVIGGWQVTGISTFAMGQFFSVTLPGNWMNIGSYTIAVPNKVGPTYASPRTLLHWFNVDSFEYPGCSPGITPNTTYSNCPNHDNVEGNAGRDQIEAPGLNDWDLGVMKHTQINERFGTEFRAEFFNAWNHPNFGTPSTSYVPATFGRITSLLIGDRVVQLGLKLNF